MSKKKSGIMLLGLAIILVINLILNMSNTSFSSLTSTKEERENTRIEKALADTSWSVKEQSVDTIYDEIIFYDYIDNISYQYAFLGTYSDGGLTGDLVKYQVSDDRIIFSLYNESYTPAFTFTDEELSIDSVKYTRNERYKIVSKDDSYYIEDIIENTIVY